MSSKLWRLFLFGAAAVLIAVNLLLWQNMQAGVQQQLQSTLAQQQALTAGVYVLERQPANPRAPETAADVTVTLVDELGNPASGQVQLRELAGTALMRPAQFQQTGDKVIFPAIPFGLYELSVRTADNWAGCVRKVLVRPEATSFEFTCPSRPEKFNTLRVELTPPENLRASSRIYVVVIQPDGWLTLAGNRWAIDENPVTLVYGKGGEFLGQLSKESTQGFLSSDAPDKMLRMEFPILAGDPPEARTRSGFVKATAFTSSEYRNANMSPLVGFKLSGAPVGGLGVDVPLSVSLLKDGAGVLAISPEHQFWEDSLKGGRAGMVSPVFLRQPRGGAARGENGN